MDEPDLAIIDMQLPSFRLLAVASTQSGMFVSEHKLRPHLARSSLMLVAAVAVSPLFMAQMGIRVLATPCPGCQAAAGPTASGRFRHQPFRQRHR
jgi:hypothetical protein